jgi:hypothetical protein
MPRSTPASALPMSVATTWTSSLPPDALRLLMPIRANPMPGAPWHHWQEKLGASSVRKRGQLVRAGS